MRAPTPVSYIAPGESTSPKFCRAFASGCRGVLESRPQLQPGPVALFGSPQLWPLLTEAQQSGRTWYYGDHGYFGRGHFYRITRNAYQCTATLPSDCRRFEVFNRPVQPWRRRGRHVLVCQQSAAYFQLYGLDVNAWTTEVTTTIRQHTKRPVRLRSKHDARPIDADLSDAWAVVTFSSAAALDALIAGVPVFVLASFAAAARMGLSDLTQIERPSMPEGREAFLATLADQQWTLAEIAAGVAWEALREH